MNNNKEWDMLFKLVWNNIYLFKYIFNYIRLYKKNEIVIFNDLTTLRRYKEREYIRKLVYKGTQQLKNGDLPSSPVIREIELTKIELLSTPGEFIPHGVEILTYSNFGWNSLTKQSNKLKSTPFSTLPKTIHTINNAVILLQPPPNNDDNTIPPNIKSISIINSPIITQKPGSENPYLKIPNTIKSLKFKDRSYSFNGYIQLEPGDIPNGITKLSINSNRFEMKFGIIPESVSDLSITCYKYIKGLSNPRLSITRSIDKNGIFPSSLTRMEILSRDFPIVEFLKFTPSLPKSITTLVLPRTWSDRKLKLPSTIKNVSYTIKQKVDIDQVNLDFSDLSLTNKKHNK